MPFKVKKSLVFPLLEYWDGTLSAISLISTNTTLNSTLSLLYSLSTETNPITPLLANRIAWNFKLKLPQSHMIFGLDFFWTLKFFGAQIFLNPKIFWPKIFLEPKVFYLKIFLTKYFFWTQNFLDLKFLKPKIFWNQKFFWTQKVLGSKIFFNTKIFLTQNFFWP
jgi:hypothetical protein